jgi:hypothetical protein
VPAAWTLVGGGCTTAAKHMMSTRHVRASSTAVEHIVVSEVCMQGLFMEMEDGVVYCLHSYMVRP